MNVKIEKLEEKITLKAGTTATYVERVLTVKGPKGEISRQLFHPAISLSIGSDITLVCKKATMREKKQLFTFKAHITNMVKGVTNGFTYKLKICSGHFPMSVAIKNNKFDIKNFIGEKVPRVLIIKEGADVKMDGDIITVTGIDKEIVGQVAADIEQLSKRSGFDSRIFQDGIFITEKDGKVMGQ